MLPSFLGIVAQGGGAPPPPLGVLISGQTLDVTYLTTTPAETFNFGGNSTYLTNGEFVTVFSYANDSTTAFGLDLTGLTALTTATVYANAAMTSAPDFTGLTALTTADVYANAAMTTPPDFTDCTALANAGVYDNPAMTTAPDFTGLTALTTALVSGNASMTSAPDFTGCTALITANVYDNASMTSAPDFTGCTALATADVSSCAISDINLLAMCVQIYDDAPANGTLAMEGGTNGSFDGQSLPSEITDLQANGWTVTFNDNNP